MGTQWKLLLGLAIIAFIPSAVFAEKWDISQNNTITVSVIKNEHFDYFKENFIWQGLEAYDTTKDGKYYGWNYALQSLDHRVPQFSLTQGPADIEITLLNSSLPYSGLAKTYSENNTINYATITVFEIDELDKHELLMVMRHELGHVLGLGHSHDPHDLMNHKIPYYTPYISDQNLDDIRKIYVP